MTKRQTRQYGYGGGWISTAEDPTPPPSVPAWSGGATGLRAVA